jgi:hypothetical protein
MIIDFLIDMLLVVFKLLFSANLELQCQILSDLMMLLSHAKNSTEENNECELMLSHFGWQDYFFNLLSRVTFFFETHYFF